MKEHRKNLTRLEQLAVWITDKVGSMGFFIIIFVWTIIWLGWNTLAPQASRFDPFLPLSYGFLYPICCKYS